MSSSQLRLQRVRQEDNFYTPSFFMTPSRFAIALLLSCATAQTQAQIQTQVQEPQTIAPVEVRGRKKTLKERAEFQHHAQTTEVLTEEELRRNNPAFIEQSLGTVAGVQVDKRTQLGGQRIVIRGYGNDQKFNNWGIKAYLAGFPLTNAEGVTLLDDVDFSLLNNIEIIKGPAGTEYGGGAGGTVRFYLRTPQQKGISLQEEVTGGSFGLFQSTSRLDVATDSTAQSLAYTHLQSDGYRPNGASLKNFLTYFADFKVGARQKISAFISHNYSREGVSGQISYDDYYAGIDKGNLAYLKKNARAEFLSTRASIGYSAEWRGGWSNQTNLFYSNGDYRRVAAGADENSTNANFGVRSVFGWKRNVGNDFTNSLNFGTEIQQSRILLNSNRFTGTNDSILLQVQPIGSSSLFRYQTGQQAYFVQNRFTYKPLELSIVLGISANKVGYRRADLLAAPGLITGYNKDLSFEKNFAVSYNPHVALQKVWKAQIFHLGYSEGFNAPTATTAFTSALGVVNDALKPEKARMVEASVQGLLWKGRIDYQVSVFQTRVENKLTQLSGVNPTGGAAYAYWANTGNQQNRGLEVSIGSAFTPGKGRSISRIEPFGTLSYYKFEYTDFTTRTGTAQVDYSSKQVVGVPKVKATLGLDLVSSTGIYVRNTFNYNGEVFSDFGNTNRVASFTQLNSKLGYRHTFSKADLDLDIFAAGNNLTNQINYTFLFLGNSVSDSDPGSGYAKGVATDVVPGPSKAYFFGGISLKKRF